MKILLLVVGKTGTPYIRQGIDEYLRRLQHYADVQLLELPDIKNTKNLSEEAQKAQEGKAILATVTPADHLTLLDEHGKQVTSIQFSKLLQQRMLSGSKRWILAIGGPYGFSNDVKQRANDLLSLSLMTFPHELVRVILAEQLYRAFTILRHEPYHHE